MGNDLVERQAAIDALDGNVIVTSRESAQAVMDYIRGCTERIRSLPSAQPDLDEWCTDCKEYDKERNSCPRWNRVIKETLKDLQEERKTQLSEESTTSDYINRCDAIDAVKKNTFRLTFAEEQNCEGHVAWSANAVYSDVIEGKLLGLPSAQPDLDSAYTEGYTQAEAKYRALWDEMPKIIRCKDCKHKPHPSDKYDYDNGDCGFEIIFPDYRCPCRCDDEYYNRIPDDDWFCGNAERRTDATTI